VDDDADFRKLFAKHFGNYNITQSPDGETALSILKKPNMIDLVLLDVRMPGLSGIEVLAEIKKIKPGIKVAMLTGSGSKDVVIEALKNRADEFIRKPLDADSAGKIIEKLLGDIENGNIPDSGNTKSKMEKVKKFIERNYDKKVSLADAASHTGLSAKYLSRAFRETYGTGFSNYKSGVMVRKAKELLKRGFNTTQISEKLAYLNPQSFILTFKKHTGFTPVAYRNRKVAAKKHLPPAGKARPIG
jgi:YesN/AraC family two-component response regulator